MQCSVFSTMFSIEGPFWQTRFVVETWWHVSEIHTKIRASFLSYVSFYTAGRTTSCTCNKQPFSFENCSSILQVQKIWISRTNRTECFTRCVGVPFTKHSCKWRLILLLMYWKALGCCPDASANKPGTVCRSFLLLTLPESVDTLNYSPNNYMYSIQLYLQRNGIARWAK